METEDSLSTLRLQFECIRGFLELQNFNEAWRELEDVPLNARRDLGYRWMRINTLIGLGRSLDAVRAVDAICREYPEDHRNWLFLADLASETGSPMLAAEVLTEARAHNNHPEVRYELAARLSQSGLTEEAEEELSAILAISPEHGSLAQDDPRFEAMSYFFMEIEE
jgi:tetratricopeptide (TPR) repeat protein